MAEKKSTKAKAAQKKRVVRKVEESEPAGDVQLCEGKLWWTGFPCEEPVKLGKKFCQWHDPEDENWREIYARLKRSTPKEKADMVLRLMEEHPDHHLILPERDGQKADLSRIEYSSETVAKKKIQNWYKGGTSWSPIIKDGDRVAGANIDYADIRGANLKEANLSDASLMVADIQGAYLFGANLINVKLGHANLQNADFEDAVLLNAYLGFANLQDANLEDANLNGARLHNANLQGAKLRGAYLRDADLRDAMLQNVDMSKVADMSGIYISGAWLDKTRMSREQLGDVIGEEKVRWYAGARQGYLALKQNFDDLGEYEAASWAYRKERRMEKLEAKENGQKALFPNPINSWEKRSFKKAVANYSKFFSDTVVEWLCDYGESASRVIGWIAILLLIVGPLLFSGVGGIVWNKELSHQYFAVSGFSRFLLWYRIYLLYTLDTLTTASFSGLQPINDWVKLFSGLFAIIGVFLAGLLGFVAGNRIRRS